MFNSANATIITKSDLADAVECDGAAAGGNIQGVRPDRWPKQEKADKNF
jgi:hypothetical protein